MGSNELFGWNLLYKIVEKDVSQKPDVLIAMAHWFLVSQASFSCIGVGEEKTMSTEDLGSELLPDGWNDCRDRYALRYIHNDELYILLGANTEDSTIINLLNVKNNNVSNLTLHPEALVKSINGKGTDLLFDNNLLLNRFKKELLEPVFSGNTAEVTTQTADLTTTNSGMHHNVPNPLLVNPGSSNFPSARDIFRDPIRDVGRGDLDPFGRGGGMLFQPPPPFAPGNPLQGGPDPFSFPRRNMPRPGPPGSRFDPFGPPDANVRPNPNNDIFRPPYDDNMYM